MEALLPVFRPVQRPMSGFVRPPKRDQSDTQKTVSALRQPGRYPEATARVTTIETHMAWVFLTDIHAYKLKKPLRTSLIDHTTVDARRQACETELALNQRLAAPVYRAVVPVTQAGDEIAVDGPGHPVDWLVKMRRLPQARMLDACIERDAVSHDAVRHLGATLTAFYLRATPLDWQPERHLQRIRANIRSKGASLQRPKYGLDRATVQAVINDLIHWTVEHAALLGPRGARVVDAHGDLRPEHVCLTDPPMIIDCLEFNRSLRLHDPVSDLSFLSLECRRLEAPWIGERLLAHYRTQTGDLVSPRLIPFYERYHALIRAAIAIWHLDDTAVHHPDWWRQQAETYLRLARPAP